MKGDSKYSAMNIGMVEKLAYLYVAFESFVCNCIPRKEQNAILSLYEKAIAETFIRHDWSPKEILEKYIKDQFAAKHFARIRGVGSDRLDVRVWYDVGKEIFLLPRNMYFSELQGLIPDLKSVTQAQWEQRLMKEELILYANRKNQKRRSFEIVLAKDAAKKQSVLKIPVSTFSKSFFEDIAVKNGLKQMEADTSSLRS